MVNKCKKKQSPRLEPLSRQDALAIVLDGRQIDYGALARIGDVISGKPVVQRVKQHKRTT